METNDFLAYNLGDVKEKLMRNGYQVEVKYINCSQGNARVVRLKEKSPQKIEILASCQKNDLNYIQ